MLVPALIILVLFGSSGAVATSESEIVYSLVLFRHGDRTPGHLIPSLAADEPNWPNGLEQLTKRGMQQCFQLGQYLRKKYSTLLSPGYKKDEVYIQSSDIDRAIQSGLSVAAGLYPVLHLEHNWSSRIPWQPIPVHTRPHDEDPWLKPSHFECPNLKTWRKKHNKPQWKRLLADNSQYQALLAYMRNVTGWPDMDLNDVRDVTTPLVARKLNGIDWPSWMNDSLWEQINEIKNMHYDIKYDEPVEKKLAGGILLGDLIEQFWKKARNETEEKLRLYSAHAGTVIPFMQALGIYNGRFPPYAAAVIVELWKKDYPGAESSHLENSVRSVPKVASGINSIPKVGSNDMNMDDIGSQYFVRILYRNDSESLDNPSDVAHQMSLAGCVEQNCTLAKFEKLLDGKYYTKINDLKKDCGIAETCDSVSSSESKSSSSEEKCSSESDFVYRIG